MLKYIKIYIWQALSILLSFAAVFVVTPFISTQPNLFGIYSVILAAYLFISYADFGFLGAGMKYASEFYAQKRHKEEIEIIGFTGAVFFAFVSLYSVGVLAISFNPTLLVNGITDSKELEIARYLLVITALSCPFLVVQRIIQIIFGIRLEDYKFQRILIGSNVIKLISAFFFFSNGRYMIVEYFFFSQLCMVTAVVFGLFLISRNQNYSLFDLFKAFRLSKKMFDKTKRLAFTSLAMTISWIFYYELDTFAIARIFGATSVATYVIGFTIITYFRSLFGILFTPFIARFNYFVGLNDKEGLRRFFLKVVVLFLPVTVFPVISIYLTVDNLVLSWVGLEFTSSISIARVLTLSYVFSFITYPSGILIMANERIRALYFTSALQPIIFWFGVWLTIDFLGLQAFAYFKFVAVSIETIVYSIIIFKLLNLKTLFLFRYVFIPFVLPMAFVMVLLILAKPFLSTTIGVFNLLSYFLTLGIINLLGVVVYYFTSNEFRTHCEEMMQAVFKPGISLVNPEKE